ncbi:hypothetical protein MLOOGBEN_19205 [Bacillus sp. EB106-08-02-XG196]|uniref:oligopeptide/dipeptide ABC transporter ATP-binding protein n=1 Tax=Bacillus sp. EB106-08-02-XG196 TaxID=2737049 RepID=UPI0015C436E9|nr:oligopeptide/dipeptide ABC transporter ATP-binding protein [Bacillus sp. EB106-08-02-XG196]NWQ42834.1 hypothetical protein [Bacillus sp. EB106-08-02-XG196]
MGICDQIFNEPKHPYTKALLASIPIANPQNAENKKRVMITGDLPKILLKDVTFILPG